jgi:thioredoxin-dependent peroxiredoxin
LTSNVNRMGKVTVGDVAPGFTLPGTGHKTYSLSDFKGKPVVLVFYPGDNTPVCTRQLQSYTQNWEQFEGIGATVLALSPQDVDSHEGFSCKHGFPFPLLADTDKKVGEAYGILGPLGFYRRSVFVVDGAGVIRYAHRSSTGLTYRSTDELVAAVKAAADAG